MHRGHPSAGKVSSCHMGTYALPYNHAKILYKDMILSDSAMRYKVFQTPDVCKKYDIASDLPYTDCKLLVNV